MFKSRINLLNKLRHSGVKAFYWEKISQLIGFTFIPTVELTLFQFFALNLDLMSDSINVITNQASQEYEIENSLDAMDKDFQSYVLKISEYQHSNHFYISEVDSLFLLLEDQILLTQNVLSSPYVSQLNSEQVKDIHFCNFPNVS
jgi:hypothetical protein